MPKGKKKKKGKKKGRAKGRKSTVKRAKKKSKGQGKPGPKKGAKYKKRKPKGAAKSKGRRSKKKPEKKAKEKVVQSPKQGRSLESMAKKAESAQEVLKRALGALAEGVIKAQKILGGAGDAPAGSGGSEALDEQAIVSADKTQLLAWGKKFKVKGYKTMKIKDLRTAIMDLFEKQDEPEGSDDSEDEDEDDSDSDSDDEDDEEDDEEDEEDEDSDDEDDEDDSDDEDSEEDDEDDDDEDDDDEDEEEEEEKPKKGKHKMSKFVGKDVAAYHKKEKDWIVAKLVKLKGKKLEKAVVIFDGEKKEVTIPSDKKHLAPQDDD